MAIPNNAKTINMDNKRSITVIISICVYYNNKSLKSISLTQSFVKLAQKIV